MAFRSLILITCALTAVGLIARILFLLGWRQPRLATTGRHDYDEAERRADEDWRAVQPAMSTSPVDLAIRNVDLRATSDVDGTEHRSDVVVTVDEGYAPEPRTIVWIDPGHPDRATARGPGFWAMWLALDAIVVLPVLIRMH